jgi:hypothetical protein
MNKWKYALRIGIAELISLISIYYVISFTRKVPASYSVFTLLGGALFNSKSSILTLLFALLPTFLLSFFLVSYIEDDYSNCCVYIFTRTTSRFSWFVKKAIGLLGWIFTFYLLEYFLLFIFVKVNVITVDFEATIILSLSTLPFNVLSLFMLLLPINLLAVKVGTVISYLIGISTYLLLLIAGIFSSSEISSLLPVSQGMYAWHQTPFVLQQNYMQITPLPNFNVCFSLIYMIIAITVEIVIGIFLINKMDLLTVPEGEN